MPALFATGTAGVLSSWELNRLAAALQGTYGWSVQSGAVTFSAGYVFNVAATAIGDNTVNGVVSTAAYAGGTVTLTTADPTNPRVDVVVITSGGAVSVIAGTPAALTTTSGPVPTAPSASQLEIARIYVPANNTPAMSATSITDKRATLGSASTLAGQLAALFSTTSTTAVDATTIAVSIPITRGIIIHMAGRKQAIAANRTVVGLKLNATVVLDAVVGTGIAVNSVTLQAENWFLDWVIFPRSSANHLGSYYVIAGSSVVGTGATGLAVSLSKVALSAEFPNATITSVIPRLINDTNSNVAELTTCEVYTF